MDKQEVLKEYRKTEDRILLSQVLDKIEIAEKKKSNSIYRFFRYVSK